MSLSTLTTPFPIKNLANVIAEQRIRRDLKEIQTNDPCSPIIFANEIDDNLFHIEAAISGPSSTPYDGGVFLLDIKLSDQYPFLPPEAITFKRAMMHPNVNEYGKFMSDLLKPESWSPAITIKHILEHVWARLAVPDIDSNECDTDRAHSYRTDKEQFEKMARDYSIQYAAAVEV